MVDLKDQHLQLIKEILHTRIPQKEVRLFGSRVNGTAQEFSDVDLVIPGEGRIDQQDIEQIKQALSESDLPLAVDVVDRYDLPASIQTTISKRSVILQDPSS